MYSGVDFLPEIGSKNGLTTIRPVAFFAEFFAELRATEAPKAPFAPLYSIENTRTPSLTGPDIVTEGTEKGELRKICADTECPVHHPKKQRPAGEERIKAEQEKQRREEALANAVGLRVLSAVTAAVPVRLTKRDLVFIVERLLPQLEERRIEVLARSRGIKKAQAADSIGKLMGAYIHKAEEGELGRLLVETVILHSARTQSETGKALKDAAQHYKVDTDAIAEKVKAEFAAKEKAQAVKKTAAKAQPKPARATATKKAKAA